MTDPKEKTLFIFSKKKLKKTKSLSETLFVNINWKQYLSRNIFKLNSLAKIFLIDFENPFQEKRF